MNDSKGPRRFPQDVFPGEIAELRRRRANARDPRPLPDHAEAPNTDLDLVGLACSGGGIRSASFCLGVVQHLIKTGHLAKVDYVSTVSGGGYLGSLLGSLMQRGVDGEKLLVEPKGGSEPPALNHVRNNSNYLVPVGVLNRLRLPAIFVTGLFQVLLLTLPLIVAAVFVTELLFEVSERFVPGWLQWLPLIGLAPLVSAFFVRPMRCRWRWWFKGDWDARDRMDRRLGTYILLAVCSLAAVPIVGVVRHLVDQDAGTVFSEVGGWLSAHFERGLGSWVLWATTLAVAGLVYGFVKLRQKMVVAVLVVAGPSVLLAIYLTFCALIINSPHVDTSMEIEHRSETLASSEDQHDEVDSITAHLRDTSPERISWALTKILAMKQVDPDRYNVEAAAHVELRRRLTSLVHRVPSTLAASADRRLVEPHKSACQEVVDALLTVLEALDRKSFLALSEKPDDLRSADILEVVVPAANTVLEEARPEDFLRVVRDADHRASAVALYEAEQRLLETLGRRQEARSALELEARVEQVPTTLMMYGDRRSHPSYEERFDAVLDKLLKVLKELDPAGYSALEQEYGHLESADLLGVIVPGAIGILGSVQVERYEEIFDSPELYPSFEELFGATRELRSVVEPDARPETGDEWKALVEEASDTLSAHSDKRHVRSYQESYECVAWALMDVLELLDPAGHRGLAKKIAELEGSDALDVMVPDAAEILKPIAVEEYDRMLGDDPPGEKRGELLEAVRAFRHVLDRRPQPQDFVLTRTEDRWSSDDSWLVWVADKMTTGDENELHITFYPEQQRAYVPELALVGWWPHTEWWFYLAGALLCLWNWWFLDINRISLHPFYRDRLSQTFLIRRGADGLERADDLRLSELGAADSAAPYHIINCALNLQGCTDPHLRERKTVPFVFTKRCSGSDFTGYRATAYFEKLDPHLNLGTALAISAAAASPNMGALPGQSLAFLMTLLNVRLNYWLPNPIRPRASGVSAWVPRGTPGLGCLISEALGSPNARSKFVNLSDGGHIENLAIYELLRRRCRVIIGIDGEADPGFNFNGLVTLQRYAQIDFDTEIDIDVSGVYPDGAHLNASHYAIGKINYPDCEPGVLLYLKLSYSGDEPEYLRAYRKQCPQYPHEPTSDQFFEETKFEVYRALGEHVAEQAFADPAVLSEFRAGGPPERAERSRPGADEA